MSLARNDPWPLSLRSFRPLLMNGSGGGIMLTPVPGGPLRMMLWYHKCRFIPGRPCPLLTGFPAVKAKRSRSAVGPDGVSKADLLALTPPFVDRLLRIVACAEETGRWPQQMLNASVASVEKVPDAEQVSQFRPICVLPPVQDLEFSPGPCCP